MHSYKVVEIGWMLVPLELPWMDEVDVSFLVDGFPTKWQAQPAVLGSDP